MHSIKHILCALFLTALLTLAAASSALADQGSFNMECWVKIGSSATLYKVSSPDGGLVIGGEGSLSDYFTEAGTIPGGTYVKITNSLSSYGLDQISYWSGGGTASGYVLSSAIVEAVGVVYLDDGTGVEIPEAMVGHTAAIISYLSSTYSNATFTPIEGSNLIHVEYTGRVDWKRVTTERLAFTYSVGGEEREVEMVVLGSAYSIIRVDNKTLTVPTSMVHWDSKADEDKQLAFVNAPKNGRASLHLKSSKRSLILYKCPQGQLLAVINRGKTYTKVWCDGYVGYVLTKALNFCPHEMPDASLKLAYVTYNGKIKSRNEVNVRASAKSTSRIVGTFPAGTMAFLFGVTEDGEWCEVEVHGVHCYIRSEFLTLATDLGI